MDAKPGKPQERPRIKLTVEIDVELDSRLYILAKSLGAGKTVLAARLMDQGMRRYREDALTRELVADMIKTSAA